MSLHTAENPLAGAAGRSRPASPPPGLANLRAVVLLAGSVRPSELRRSVGRFLLELPIEADRCIMDLWHEHLCELAAALDRPTMPVRVIVDRTTLTPTRNTWNGRCDVRFEQDPLDYRGTGGLLRDLATQYEPNDHLLIVNAAQLMLDPLADVATALSELDADLALACREDASPTGIMLVRCGCLMSIPAMGFVDLNEQALPAIARDHDVRVSRGRRLGGLPIRTLSDYLDALRAFHRCSEGKFRAFPEPFREDWQATFGIIENPADVDASAVIHDSVVLRGGRVEAGGLVVRALVCPGGVVAANASAVDCLVGGLPGPHGR